jgi:hypothetical protein
VDNQTFLRLLQSVQSSTREDALAVNELLNQYPYCQALQILAAKTSQDHNLPDAAEQLQRAAVYSTDRKLLKEWMSLPRLENTALIEGDLPGEQLREELANDLQRLQILKANFERSLQNFEAARRRKKANTSDNETPARPKAKKPKKGRKKGELRKASKKKSRKDDPENAHLLHQIQDFRPKGRAVYSAKAKKQLAIIDRFIKRQPSIEKKPQAAKPGPDLSKKSGVLSEDVISTTLVDLLIRQGKKEKAIEALKKLIWKFPRKKAIFAAQIEELKK